MRIVIFWTLVLFGLSFVGQLQFILNIKNQSRISHESNENSNNYINKNNRNSKKTNLNNFKNYSQHEISLFKESMRLNKLNEVCSQSIDKKRGSPIISWNHVDNPKEFKLIYRGDFLLHEELSNCPVIDVYMAKGMKFIYL